METFAIVIGLALLAWNKEITLLIKARAFRYLHGGGGSNDQQIAELREELEQLRAELFPVE